MSANGRRKWSLDERAFSSLLSYLDTNRESAGEKYEALRTRLIRFFSWEGCPEPEWHADETLNRIAKRISEGETIDSINGFLYGAARFVLLEGAKRRRKEEKATSLQEVRSSSALPEDRLQDEREGCLRGCLESLSSLNRSLITEYYQGEKSLRIKNRKRLAREMAIPINALRNRALRLRAKLQSCVRQCLDSAEDY